MFWSRVTLLAVLGWSQWVVADVRFTMLYITNPVIYTDTPFQIVWTGAQGLVNVTMVDAADGGKTLVQSNASGTTYNWVPLESLNGHRGSLVITDGLSTDTTAVFSFEDRSLEGVVSTPSSQSSSTTVSLSSSTSSPTGISKTTDTGSSSQLTSLQSPTALTTSPTSSPTSFNFTYMGSEKSRMSLGAQAGIAIGAILFTAFGAAVLLYLCWFRKRRQASEAPQGMTRDDSEFASNGDIYGRAPPYGSDRSASGLRKAGPFDSNRADSEMESTAAVSPLSMISAAPQFPGASPYPPRLHYDDPQGSKERIHIVEGKSLRSDMLREYRPN